MDADLSLYYHVTDINTFFKFRWILRINQNHNRQLHTMTPTWYTLYTTYYRIFGGRALHGARIVVNNVYQTLTLTKTLTIAKILTLTRNLANFRIWSRNVTKAVFSLMSIAGDLLEKYWNLTVEWFSTLEIQFYTYSGNFKWKYWKIQKPCGLVGEVNFAIIANRDVGNFVHFGCFSP